MPKSGMLFSVIFLSSAISFLTPEMHDMDAMSDAAAGSRNDVLGVFGVTFDGVVEPTLEEEWTTLWGKDCADKLEDAWNVEETLES